MTNDDRFDGASAPAAALRPPSRWLRARHGTFGRSMALSALLHATAGAGITVLAGSVVVRSAGLEEVDEKPISMAVSESPEDAPLYELVALAPDSDVLPAGGDLPDAETFELPLDLTAIAPAPPDIPELDLGLEHQPLLGDEIPPLDAMHRPQPPPVVLADAEYAPAIAPGLGAGASGGSGLGGNDPRGGTGGRGGDRAGAGSGGRPGGRGGGGLLGGDLVVGGRGGSWPDLIDGPPPDYPAKARERGWEGTVVVRMHIGANGLVSSASVDKSSGYEILDHAAVTAVRSWRFSPARRFGVAIPAEILHRVTFRLADPRPR